jgi:hypothetical protein
MAITPLGFPTYNVNSTVDPSQWQTLGNLGNVYREAQATANKQRALSSLGTDPKANIQTLLTSNDPSLVQLGLSLQEKDITRSREDVRNAVADKHWGASFGIQSAAEKRAQETYEQADKDREEAAKLIGAVLGSGGAAPAASAPAPFPAPLPQVPPQAPQVPPQASVATPSSFDATPRLPSGLQPPIKAEGGDSGVPSWVQSAQENPPDTSLVGRVTSSLTSPNPAAASGISREQIAALYANPLTKPLAVAFLQKQFDPGSWTYQNINGKLMALNSNDPSKNKIIASSPTKLGEGERLVQDGKDVTPGGFVPKAQQERAARYDDAIARGYDKDTANYFALNNKLPKEDLSPTQQKMVETHDATAKTGLDVLDNLEEMKKLSKSAYEGWGATTRATAASALGPHTPQGALDTIRMQNLAYQNIVQQAKTLFPGRILKSEIDIMKQIETLPEQPDNVRQDILKQLGVLIARRVASSQETAKAIRDKTYFTKGYTPTYGQGATEVVDPMGLR